MLSRPGQTYGNLCHHPSCQGHNPEVGPEGNPTGRYQRRAFYSSFCTTYWVGRAPISQGVGLDSETTMLKQARDKLRQISAAARKRIELVRGDMRKWRRREPFDLIIVPCSSITHVLELSDQLDVWRRAFQNLRPGGRFVVEATMPNFAAYADSFANPPRAIVEIDHDVTDQATNIRLVRRRTVTYLPDEQRAQIRFVYEKYRGRKLVENYIDDFASHVYFPRELRLLFMHAGFEIEDVFGDYDRRPLRASSRQMIMTGRKPRRATLVARDL
ncbi:MAG: methyltransferase domain-containing protein [Candidatus Binatus sp.]